jgi:hypothetical protein
VICECCHGTGRILASICGDPPYPYPCPNCGGTGIAHCCEGECAQPDPTAATITDAWLEGRLQVNSEGDNGG